MFSFETKYSHGGYQPRSKIKGLEKNLDRSNPPRGRKLSLQKRKDAARARKAKVFTQFPRVTDIRSYALGRLGRALPR